MARKGRGRKTAAAAAGDDAAAAPGGDGGQDSQVERVAAAVAQMSVSSVEEAEKAKEEGAILQEQLSGAGANHAALVNRAADRICGRIQGSSGAQAASKLGQLAAVQAYEAIVRRAVALGESDATLSQRLIAAGVDSEQVKSASEALATRQPELRAAMLADASSFAGPHLADFDWKVNLTVASSSAASMAHPALQLALYVEHDGARREVMLELPEAQFASLLAAVGSARDALAKIPA